MLSFCSFSSGSSGNCYLIQTRETAILVDAGISGRKVMAGLEAAGVPAEKIKGIMITHEHTDHVKNLHVVLKKLPEAKGYANENTWGEIVKEIAEDKKEVFDTGVSFDVGDITVKPFHISHDAVEPVGFTFTFEDKQITVVTDTGCITEEILQEMKGADILVLEANHDEEILKMGRYPWHVKQRVLGNMGHLSNVAAGHCLCRWLDHERRAGENIKKVLLAHISRENNFPKMAFQTIKNILEENKYYINSSLQLTMIVKDEISQVHEA